MAQITIDASGRELAARVTRNADGEVVLVISAGEDGITINAGRTEDDADGIAEVGGAIARQAGDLLNEWADQPDEDDGWVILDRGGYYVKMGSFEPAHQPERGYPSRRIAAYELAAMMAAYCEFPPAWITGEHGPATAPLDEDVRAFRDEDGDKLLPLPGVRYADGALTLVDLDRSPAWVVVHDYGDLGVMIHAEGDPAVTLFTQHDHLTPADDEAAPGGTLVAVTDSCDIMITSLGFYARCRTCPYVSELTASKSTARTWATAHDADQPGDGRAS